MKLARRYPLIALSGWLVASPVMRWVARSLDHQPSLCPLQRIVGVPCPSCGGTRATLYLLSGDPVTAAKRNLGFVVAVLVTGVYFTYLERAKMDDLVQP